jgi:hypothetical protein
MEKLFPDPNPSVKIALDPGSEVNLFVIYSLFVHFRNWTPLARKRRREEAERK